MRFLSISNNILISNRQHMSVSNTIDELLVEVAQRLKSLEVGGALNCNDFKPEKKWCQALI